MEEETLMQQAIKAYDAKDYMSCKSDLGISWRI